VIRSSLLAFCLAIIFGSLIGACMKKQDPNEQSLYDQNIDLQLRVSSLEYRFDMAMSFACYTLTGVPPDQIMIDIYKQRLIKENYETND